MEADDNPPTRGTESGESLQLGTRSQGSRPRQCRALCAMLGALVLSSATAGCVTVRPEQRAILADPKMRIQGDPRAAAQLEHALENREGSFGGGSVQGGGCGCN